MPAPLPEDAAGQSGTFVAGNQGEAGELQRFSAVLEDFSVPFRSGSPSAESGESEEPESEDEDKTSTPLPDPSLGNVSLSASQVAALLLANQWFVPSQPAPVVVSQPPEADQAAEVGLGLDEGLDPARSGAVEAEMPAQGSQRIRIVEPAVRQAEAAATDAARQNAAVTLPATSVTRIAPPTLTAEQGRGEGVAPTYWRVRSDAPRAGGVPETPRSPWRVRSDAPRAGDVPETPRSPDTAGNRNTSAPGEGFEIIETQSAPQGRIAFAAEIGATQASAGRPPTSATEASPAGEGATILTPDTAVSKLQPTTTVTVPGQRGRQDLPRSAATLQGVISAAASATESAGQLPGSEPTAAAQRRQAATAVSSDPAIPRQEPLENSTVRPAQGVGASDQPESTTPLSLDGAESGGPQEPGKTNREKPAEPVKFENEGSHNPMAESSAPQKAQPAATSSSSSHPWVSPRQEAQPAAAKVHTGSPAATQPAPADPQTGLEADAGRKAATPVQGIHLRMSDRRQESGVDVQVVERNGRLQVAVRTDDPVLQSALRDDLGRLVARVEDQGLRAEVWTPSGGATQQGGQNGDTPQQSRFSFNESPSGGQSGGGEAKDQQDGRQNRPAWLDQLEESFNLSSTENKEENEWARILRR